MVSSATRQTPSSSTLIDHIYTSSSLSEPCCVTLPPVGSSDHFTVSLDLHLRPPTRPKIKPCKLWIYKKADFDAASKCLNCIPISLLPSSPDSFWSAWSDLFLAAMKDCVPSKFAKPKLNNIPYLSLEQFHLIRKRNRLFKLAKRKVSERAWTKYSIARNQVTYSIRRAKKKYLKQLAVNIGSPNDFGKSYHKLSPKSSRIPSKLSFNDSTANSTEHKAELLNSFFTSCFCGRQDLTTQVPPSISPSTSEPVITEDECTLEEVTHHLATQKTNTATGADGISGHMLRGTANAIAPALTTLFNESLRQGQIPKDWKISNITPIPKSGDPSLVNNYRPISLLSLVSKILERIVHSNLMDYLTHHNHISPNQFGFRPRSSTQEALLKVTNCWHHDLKHNKQVGVVFFDIRKAFDSVPHTRLLSALADVGVRGNLLNWFSDYLSNMKQRVVLDGVASSLTHAFSGVPQGSILGPLLFIVFMNSITHLELSHGSNITLYADDILLYKPINSADDLILLQQDVDSVLNWIQSNSLSPNTAKTQLINSLRSPKATPLHITVNGHTVHQSDSAVYLGVTLNSSLSWSTHIKNTCRSTIRQLGLIHRKLHSAPQSVRLKICSSVVLPRLDYCCAVWDPHLA